MIFIQFSACFSLFSHGSSLVDITDMSEHNVDELRRRMVTVEWMITEHFIFLFWDSGLWPQFSLSLVRQCALLVSK